MEHEVYIEAEVEISPAVEEQIRQAVLAALEAEAVGVPCIVEVCVTDDENIRQTNLETRGVDRATDVLSFPMFELSPGEKPHAEWADPDTGKVLLGDMMLSLERANAQAEEYGHSPEREVCYLAVHSVLHLLGYDHLDEGPMKAQMREREEAVLSALGITRENPSIEIPKRRIIMKKIKLTPVEREYDDYEDEAAEEGIHLEFDLTPYVVTCAMACGMLFVTRFVQKHFLKK